MTGWEGDATETNNRGLHDYVIARRDQRWQSYHLAASAAFWLSDGTLEVWVSVTRHLSVFSDNQTPPGWGHTLHLLPLGLPSQTESKVAKGTSSHSLQMPHLISFFLWTSPRCDTISLWSPSNHLGPFFPILIPPSLLQTKNTLGENHSTGKTSAKPNSILQWKFLNPLRFGLKMNVFLWLIPNHPIKHISSSCETNTSTNRLINQKMNQPTEWASLSEVAFYK